MWVVIFKVVFHDVCPLTSASSCKMCVLYRFVGYIGVKIIHYFSESAITLYSKAIP